MHTQKKKEKKNMNRMNRSKQVYMDQIEYANTTPPRSSTYFNEAIDSIYYSGTVRGTEVSSSGNVLFE